MKDSQSKAGFDRVFDVVGSNGPYQYTLLFIASLQCIILSWHHLGYVFLGAVPNHWCRIPELEGNGWTPESIRNLSIPPKTSGQGYESCRAYDLNYSILSNVTADDGAGARHLLLEYDTANATKCQNGWHFDSSTYVSTLVTEFQIVCDNRYLVATIQASYMCGVFIGSLILGSLSDRFIGRRKSVLISITLVLFGGIAAGYSATYWELIIFRFFVAFGAAGAYQNCYVLLMEYSGTKSRSTTGMIQQLPFALGHMLMAAYGYYVRDWRTLQLAFSITSIILVSYFWILPESARWLAVVANDTEGAINYLVSVARRNKKKGVTREQLLEIINSSSELQGRERKPLATFTIAEPPPKKVFFIEWSIKVWSAVKKTLSIYLTLLATPEMRKRTLLIWFLFISVDLVYYGVVFNSATLTNDPYLLVFLGGLSEVPAYSAFVPFLEKWGRRPTIMLTFLGTAFCTLTVAYVSMEQELLRMVLSMFGKLFITTSFAVIYLLGTELYPTSTRTTGLAAAVFMGRVGSILAPYIVDGMKSVYTDLPNIIFGVTCLVSGVVSLLIPETKDLEMADQLYDVEEGSHATRTRRKSKSQSQSVTGEVTD